MSYAINEKIRLWRCFLQASYFFYAEDPNKFKGWWDNVFATMEMEDIGEYVTKAYVAIDMPTTVSKIPQDSTNVQQVEKCKTKSRIRK